MLTALDLVPPKFAQENPAYYRTLLPLYNETRDEFAGWASLLPGGQADVERLRTMDLDQLREEVRYAGKNPRGIDEWDSARGNVSEHFINNLEGALAGFVPEDAGWSLMRWAGYGVGDGHAEVVIHGAREYRLVRTSRADALASIREFGMPDFMWSSTHDFAWGAPLYPDYGVMTMAPESYIQYFAAGPWEAFNVAPSAELPDSLGD